MNKIYLASKSPRRQELLKQIGVEFELLSVDVAEVKSPIESAEEFVVRVAVDKASAGWDTADRREDLPGSDPAVDGGDSGAAFWDPLPLPAHGSRIVCRSPDSNRFDMLSR